MSLVEDYFLIAHDDRTGRLRRRTSGGLGLAAAMLGELMLDQQLTVVGERGSEELWLVPTRDPPADYLLAAVMSALAEHQLERRLADWLRYLAADAVVDVGQHLSAAGMVREARGSFGRGRRGYLPVAVNAAVVPENRLARQLTEDEDMDVPDLVLAGLVHVTGLADHVLWDKATHLPGRRRLPVALEGLPAQFRALLACTEEAISSRVRTKRA